MRKPVNIENQEDVEFLTALFEKMALREDRRRQAESKVFSPSALASCLRHVYLNRNHESLGIEAVLPPRIEPNFYFATGNFLHVKWQFVLYKMDKHYPDKVFQLVDVERSVISKRGDHGGTLDAIVRLYGVLHPVDFKGLNVRSFTEITRGNMPFGYSMQLADYMVLYNSERGRKTEPMQTGLLIAENKGGPTNGYPIALHETEIAYIDWKPEINLRLEVLRASEEANLIPEPECTGTTTLQFQGCPFKKFCRDEVKQIEAKRRSDESSNPSEYRLATPRTNRSRRRSKR
jgi:hypothetical protein